jgi:hypothetical protein
MSGLFGTYKLQILGVKSHISAEVVDVVDRINNPEPTFYFLIFFLPLQDYGAVFKPDWAPACLSPIKCSPVLW